MYANGIRKILCPVDLYGDVGMLIERADKLGYDALLHNGKVWVKAKRDGGNWIETPFTIEDFK